jgi:nucleoside-diphosphate-sugar epimerase
LLAADAEDVSGAVLNVATGRQLSVNDLADAVGEVLGLSVEKQYLPQRAGDVRDSWADCREAQRLLGYEPAVGLREGPRRVAESLVDSAVSRAL